MLLANGLMIQCVCFSYFPCFRLRYCDITDDGCSALTSALRSNPSHLRELDLSGNKVKNKGVKHLCDDPNCQLKTLRFNCISITEEGCAALASAFNSNPSNLIELDLSGNKLGNSGVTEISTLLENSQCTLQILRFEFGEFKDEQKIYDKLDLTGNDPGQSGVKELDDLLQDPNCQLKTLR
uniref:Uncharacterized protein n=1 Tax=Sinocyclocheilus rhinocerous TaxID=307959 RepID=A0A673I4H4_9TELE